MASTLERNENNFTFDSTLQIDVDGPWWTQHRRRRARSPLYSEHSDVEELPELVVERKRPPRATHEDVRKQLRGDAPCKTPPPRKEMNQGSSQSDESGGLSPLPPEANVTIRTKQAPSRHQNPRVCKRRDIPFEIYQLCNCTDHVCPNPYHRK